MTSNRVCLGLRNAMGRRALCGFSLVLAIAVAVPEELPAAPMVNMTIIQPTFARADLPTTEVETLLVHCCHPHPYPPYDDYCCDDDSTVVVVPGYSTGPASVRGTARRTARRTTRRHN